MAIYFDADGRTSIQLWAVDNPRTIGLLAGIWGKNSGLLGHPEWSSDSKSLVYWLSPDVYINHLESNGWKQLQFHASLSDAKTSITEVNWATCQMEGQPIQRADGLANKGYLAANDH